MTQILTKIAAPKILNLGLKDVCKDGIKSLGFNLEDLLEQERDAALGNGGLGRLAACYLDSSASQVTEILDLFLFLIHLKELPVWGYGLRYKYGIFQQLISPEGNQLEVKLPSLTHHCYMSLYSFMTGSRPLARTSESLGGSDVMVSLVLNLIIN